MENSRSSEKHGRKWCLVALIAVAAAGLAVFIRIQTERLHEQAELKRLESKYRQAVSCMENGDYSSARYKFSSCNDYKDALILYWYCAARDEYDEADPYSWRDTVDDLDHAARCRSLLNVQSDFAEEIEAFDKKVRSEKEAQDREWEYAKKVKEGLPFVGMRSEDIGKTYLGLCDSCVEDGDMTTYTWYSESGKTMVFEAETKDGVVITAQKYNSKCWIGDKLRPAVDRSKWYENTDKDEYGASDYLFPEDFDEDYWDEFYDYDDMEDYWYEHQ